MQDGKFVVLCIDDDADVRDSLKLVIESTGYAVAEQAESGAQGVEKFADVEPDMVLCDLMMESVDAGLDAATKIRQRDAEVPIYMLTSVGDQLAETVDTASARINGVFQKPIEPEKLLECMERRLGEIAAG